MSPEKKEGLYVYGFFEGGKLPSLIGKGVDLCHEVVSLPYRQISAALSIVSLEEYGETPLAARLQDLHWITPRIQIHKTVIESIMEVSPVIPLRFCTIFTREERIIGILKANYRRFQVFFGAVRDKEEWGVKVYADPRQVTSTVGRISPLIRDFDEIIPLASPGEAYLLRKKRELLVQEALADFLDPFAEEIYQMLAPYTAGGRRNRLLDRRATGKGEEMILNAAFLIRKEEMNDFKKRLEKIAIAYESQGLIFELSGPWPPYNFCPVFEGSGRSAE